MEEFMNIKAESRHETGKKIAKKLRKEGKIPAIIYGAKKESIPISLLVQDVKAILKMEKGENTVLKIQRDDIEVDAMLKEIQYDYLSDNIIHVDFLRIDLNKEVFANVPVTIKGEAIGVKVDDGIFDFMTREIRIKSLPAKIPTEFILDVSHLHSGHSIKIEDMDVGEDIQILSDPNTVICAVTSKVRIEEVEEEEVPVEEGEEPAEAAEEAPAEGE
jgi:large subunit ribosomal protein L25